MDVAQIAASQVMSAAVLTHETAAIAIMKTAVEAQMQLANVIARQAEQGKDQTACSVYA